MRVRDLTISYGGEPVLEGASIEVGDGQFVSLVGPSGSGKSSLLRAVIGLQKPLAGIGRGRARAVRNRHAVPGRRAAAVEDRARQRRARPDLQRHGAQPRRWRRPTPGSARLGLAGFGDRFPRHLSGGQRKRVALAQVLAMQPKLLLMDEPFASLDAIVRARIIQDVAALVERERISVLLVTHDLEEAISLSDCVYLLSQGPRARITQQYQVPIPRPRDPVQGARASGVRAALREAVERSLPRGRFRRLAEAAE